ncbi:hypothetical protein [Algoriphagus sp. NG3]|uniref:hypothetical protein n=1 Tax=Algoriphagus sp. NG3 TaxID=3097546 RepID=UPI002A80FC5E|nr:hypothetical protein [Algoriphagus sp. NG3]WPR74424.1 hypothetical protein SLW71_17305 [Algoriphagus sp. NG3]
MKSQVITVVLVLAVFLLSACRSGSTSDEPIGFYIEKITGKPVSKNEAYILVSDYGCSSCKEEIYGKAESGSSDTVFIITSPRNKVILLERFVGVMPAGNIYINSLKYSNALDIVYSKPMIAKFQDGGWEIHPYEEGR